MSISGRFLGTFTPRPMIFFSIVINGVFFFIIFFVFLEYIKSIFVLIL